jgi:lipopolysaccharide transport system permease protein
MDNEPVRESHADIAMGDDEFGDQPPLILRAASGWQVVNLRDVWQYRDLLVALAVRDVKLRYRQTALGTLWVILQPLIAATIFAFVFGRVAKLPSDGVPYFAFAYAGLIAWNAFSSTLTKASGCMVQNAQLVSKIYFPRLVLPLSTVFSTLIDLGVSLVVMVVLMIGYRIVPHVGILLLPVWFTLVVALSIGISLFFAALMVSYRDVQYVLPVLTQFVMYASPVAYAVSAVPIRLRWVYTLNPLSGLLEAFRWSLLGRGSLEAGPLVTSTVCTLLACIGGAFYFRKMERMFADVI